MSTNSSSSVGYVVQVPRKKKKKKKRTQRHPRSKANGNPSASTTSTRSGRQESLPKTISATRSGRGWGIAGVILSVVAILISTGMSWMTLQNDNRLSAIEDPQLSVLGVPSTASVQGETSVGTVAQTDLVLLVANSGRQGTELIRFRAIESASGRTWTCRLPSPLTINAGTSSLVEIEINADSPASPDELELIQSDERVYQASIADSSTVSAEQVIRYLSEDIKAAASCS